MPGKAMTSARFCGKPGVAAPELHNSGSIPPVRCLIPERHNGGTWTLRSLTAFAVSKLALTTGSSVLLRRKMSGGGASELLNSDDLVEIWLYKLPQAGGARGVALFSFSASAGIFYFPRKRESRLGRLHP